MQRKPPLLIATIALLLCGCFYPMTGLTQSTYELTSKAARCDTNSYGVRYCTFVVGSLEFGILGIGSNDTTVHFLKSDIAEDFYAQLYVQNGCVVLLPGAKAGKKTVDRAFVAISTGKVVRTKEECGNGK